MVRRGWKLWLTAGTLCLFTSAAAATPNDADAARYADLLRKGSEAAKAGKWDACATALTEAIEIQDAPTVLGDLGLCEEQAGRFALAHKHLLRALEAAPADKQVEPWKRLQAALVRVRDRVALLIITTDPPKASIIVDGRPVGRADGQTIAVEPGRHTVAGRLEGYEDDVVQTEDLHAGDFPNIHISLRPKPRAALSSPVRHTPSAPSPPEKPSDVSRLFAPAWSPRGVLVTLAYAGTAATLVSGATAIGFEAHYQSMRASLDAKGYQGNTCRSGRPPGTPAECEEVDARLQQRFTSVNVLIGSAVTLAALWGAAGLAMYLDRSPLRPTVAATASTNGGGIVILGKW